MRSASVCPLSTSAENPPMKSTPTARGPVECAGVFEVVGIARCAGHDRDRGDRDALVDDRDPEFGLDPFGDPDQVLRALGDFVVYLGPRPGPVCIDAVEQRDAHGHRADVEFVFLDHLDGFEDIGVRIDHGGTS